MATKLMFFVVALIGALASCSAGIVPAFPVASAAYVAPYASTYNAHVVNHAIATPVATGHVAAAPLIAAPAHYAYPHAHAHAYGHAHVAAPFGYSEPLVVAK